MASNNSGGQQQNKEIINMISNRGKHLKPWKHLKKLRIVKNTTREQSDPIGYVINPSKKTFAKRSFQLFLKKLNFIPTPKVYNKH